MWIDAHFLARQQNNRISNGGVMWLHFLFLIFFLCVFLPSVKLSLQQHSPRWMASYRGCQHVSMIRANNLRSIFLFPFSLCVSSLSCCCFFVLFFSSLCLFQTVRPARPGWKTPLCKHLSQIRSPLESGTDSVCWCFSDSVRTREALSGENRGQKFIWMILLKCSRRCRRSWSKEKNSHLHIIHWNDYLHLSACEWKVQVSRHVCVTAFMYQ